ncbi:MAG: 50S ribosomal protein L25 [Candidatus Marinimicrobia bacterium]|jgi:large subunit ribosomal protein L25|nr:50S ribosomal protein L25 [Candidatus Neomarinimicrobiota bacterium]MDP6456878.1 50S ribosomal protein L25 [Candidatus Neomarinimicrobiota bacterium]MDP6593857.1 50S ribosomal protein L25 [Candidatus Neomarinimicrobiota bacterium]MDP6835905.1 50S ribosomal protein L25 [Candidatus Neomarinimicrobiota bacterium]MDP6967105.1 50S ribosomal protein L25 [Candidatus Neomarinimicrobiota bacterium]|tara:strand:- start:150 stop:851 length:702 start_codon:yes stop_codon:yes gene_type:complete
MAQEYKLELDKRTDTGRKAAKNYRSSGSIPGIFYSADHEAVSFVIDRGHLHHALQSDTHVYAVSVKGKKLHAIFKEIQYHPVTEEIAHVDLFGVSLKDKIDIVVPIIVEGEAAGVKTGGILNQNITELQINCLATEVPDAVRIDVSELEVGDTIHVEELDLEGIEILTNPEITIVSVQAPKEEIIEEPELEEEELEGEEGDAVEGEEVPTEEGEDKGAEKPSDDGEKEESASK